MPTRATKSHQPKKPAKPAAVHPLAAVDKAALVMPGRPGSRAVMRGLGERQGDEPTRLAQRPRDRAAARPAGAGHEARAPRPASSLWRWSSGEKWIASMLHPSKPASRADGPIRFHGPIDAPVEVTDEVWRTCGAVQLGGQTRAGVRRRQAALRCRQTFDGDAGRVQALNPASDSGSVSENDTPKLAAPVTQNPACCLFCLLASVF